MASEEAEKYFLKQIICQTKYFRFSARSHCGQDGIEGVIYSPQKIFIFPPHSGLTAWDSLRRNFFAG
jgi:hypothetical protein